MNTVPATNGVPRGTTAQVQSLIGGLSLGWSGIAASLAGRAAADDGHLQRQVQQVKQRVGRNRCPEVAGPLVDVPQRQRQHERANRRKRNVRHRSMPQNWNGAIRSSTGSPTRRPMI